MSALKCAVCRLTKIRFPYGIELVESGGRLLPGKGQEWVEGLGSTV